MGAVNLNELVAKVEDLPSLPLVVTQVLKLTADPDSTPEDLNQVITTDQNLTAKVLRLANSAYYGFARRIGTVTEAVILLGFNTIRNLVMAASMSPFLEREVAGYALARGELWHHSLVSAMAARLLAREVRYRPHEQAFVAGLLHDIGKVILSIYVSAEYQEIIRRVQEENIPFMTAEAEVLGFHHAQVGGLVADKWNLPQDLVEAVSLHHHPAEAKIDPRLTAITHAADAVSLMLGMGVGADGLLYPLDAGCLEVAGVQPYHLEKVMAAVGDSLGDSEALWG